MRVVAKAQLLTTTQAAAEVHLSRARILGLLRQGRIQGAVKLGRDWTIPSPVVITTGNPIGRRRRGVDGSKAVE